MILIENISSFFRTTGLFTGIPLLLCAMASTTLIVERIIFFTKITNTTVGPEGIDPFINKEIHLLKSKANKPSHEIESAFEACLETISAKLNSNLKSLRFVAGLSPMLGLFGTMLGIIDVFDAISHTHSAVSPAIISAGLKKSMLTTAFGLAISIPSHTFNFIFTAISDQKIHTYSTVLLKTLDKS